MSHTHRRACLLSALCLLMLSACAGKAGQATNADSRLPGSPRAGLPALETPAPDSLPWPDDRLAAGLTEYLIHGANAELSSAGAVPSGPALVLDASGGGSNAQWAVYRFNPGTNQQDSVSVLLDSATSSGAFIGLANYATQRWDFDGPYTAQKSFLTDSADYRSPAGNQWVAVLVSASQSATVNALSVRTINPDNVAPTAALEASPLSGDAPLTVNFDASGGGDPDGAIIEYAWDWEGDGLYDGFSDEPQVSHTYTHPGIHNARVRVTDDQFARSIAASIGIVAHGPPVAVLMSPTPSADPDTTVTLSAAGSYSPSGAGITDYEWDLNGNGLFGDTGDEFAAQGSATVQHLLGTTPGLSPVSVRVTDDRGQSAPAELELTVRGWLKLTVDAPGAVGNHTSLAVVSGRPAISYRDGTNADLKYAYSSAADGSAGWTAMTVEAPGSVGQYTSLAVVNGKPAISYQDYGVADLKYAYCATAEGSAGWTSSTVDGSPDLVGYWTSLAVVNGRPAISHYDANNADLEYAYSTAADGSSGWTAITVEAPGSVGSYTSLAVVSGRPAISYRDGTNAALKYAYSSTVDGSAGWTMLTVDAAGDVGTYTSLSVVNGRPAISYLDVTNADLKYAYSSAADGSSGWTALAVDTPGLVGYYTSLAVVNGRPAISYSDGTNGDLKYAASSTVDGSSGWTAVTVDAPGSVGQWTSLAVVNGKPAISYEDLTNFDLKYAVLYE